MSTTAHPYAQLSAFLDDALAPDDRAAVESHLAGCPACRARVEQLRATASLIASLPDPVPTRRLTPRLAAVPVWIAPLRTLATLASGLSVFLFIASAFLANITGLGSAAGTTALSAPAAAAPAVGRAEASAAPAPTAASAADRNATGTDSAQKFAASASASTSPGPLAIAPQAAATAHGESTVEPSRGSASLVLGPSPWFWLALALVMGAIALALQRRLRSTQRLLTNSS